MRINLSVETYVFTFRISTVRIILHRLWVCKALSWKKTAWRRCDLPERNDTDGMTLNFVKLTFKTRRAPFQLVLQISYRPLLHRRVCAFGEQGENSTHNIHSGANGTPVRMTRTRGSEYYTKMLYAASCTITRSRQILWAAILRTVHFGSNIQRWQPTHCPGNKKFSRNVFVCLIWFKDFVKFFRTSVCPKRSSWRYKISTY